MGFQKDFLENGPFSQIATQLAKHEKILRDLLSRTQASGGGSGVTSGPQAWGDNYVITPSVASNNLTVALKTIAGADPSAGDTITIRIGNTKQTISAAISVTKNAGTNWCNSGGAELKTKDIDFFVYLIQETGASAGTKIGFSRIPYAVTMSDFVNTSTSEKYIAGNWTNFNATDQVENIGRFRAQNSGTASFNWSIPTAKVINRPIYETDWLTWTPTTSALSPMTYTSVSVTYARYKVRSDSFVFQLTVNGTTGGTARYEISATMPWDSSLATPNAWCTCPVADGAVNTILGQAYLSAVSPNTITCRKPDTSNFGLGANRVVRPYGEFQIA